MPRLALSTSMLRLDTSASALLERWRALSEGAASALSIDPRVGPGLQHELLVETKVRGLRATEIAHPFFGPEGLVAPSFARDDPHELRAARVQLAATLERAHEHGATRVVLYPATLKLAVPAPLLRHRFALGLLEPADLLELAAERTARAAVAEDNLSLLLDGSLGRAADLGLALLLLAPPHLPHQFPDAVELARLLDRFGGSPLGWCHATDWAHAAAALEGNEGDEGDEGGPKTPPIAVRLADACGLSLRLPIGTGEIDWSRAPTFLAGKDTEELVLTLDVGVRENEASSSLERAAHLASAEPAPESDK